jgi:hypothetical protein
MNEDNSKFMKNQFENLTCEFGSSENVRWIVDPNPKFCACGSQLTLIHTDKGSYLTCYDCGNSESCKH